LETFIRSSAGDVFPNMLHLMEVIPSCKKFISPEGLIQLQ